MIRELCLIYKIWRWHEKTFDLTAHDQKQKLISEITEFNEAKAKYIKSPYPRRPKYKHAVDEELIDVIIAGINCLKYPEIYERVAVKHSINTHRTWKGNHHVPTK
jgi:hypothetical protein